MPGRNGVVGSIESTALLYGVAIDLPWDVKSACVYSAMVLLADDAGCFDIREARKAMFRNHVAVLKTNRFLNGIIT